jgi:hypothetical protein
MYSYTWLCKMMQDRGIVSLISHNKIYSGTISGIAAENGSGRSWLVSLALVGGGSKIIYIKAE